MVAVKVWDGSEWDTSDLGEALLANGGVWTYPRFKYWDGSGWVQSVGIPEGEINVGDFVYDGTATAGIKLVSNGSVQEILSFGDYPRSSWINASAVNGSLYEVYADVNLGTVTGSSTGSWLALSTTRSWQVDAELDTSSSAQLTLYIRPTGASSNSSQTTVYLSAESQSTGGGGGFVPE